MLQTTKASTWHFQYYDLVLPWNFLRRTSFSPGTQNSCVAGDAPWFKARVQQARYQVKRNAETFEI
ncbi:MAG: hypothetical protein JO159_10400 [Acidobacteria bacterium]|nr:hypothetical protein [Acidobacteriota bacterium]